MIPYILFTYWAALFFMAKIKKLSLNDKFFAHCKCGSIFFLNTLCLSQRKKRAPKEQREMTQREM